MGCPFFGKLTSRFFGAFFFCINPPSSGNPNAKGVLKMEKQMPRPEEYQKMVEKASPGSKSYKTIPLAFLTGGAICTAGEGLRQLYLMAGLSVDWASAMVSVTLIAASALLTGLGVYDNIAKVGGAGTLVPITGFANAVVSPALEFKAEGMILGTGSKLFIIAGPVIAYGLAASWVYGFIFWLLNR